MTLAMVALTTWLGLWQIRRLVWKTALLAEIDRGEAAPPVPLPADPKPFMRVVVSGRLRPMTALYGADVRATPAGPAMGGQKLQVLERPGASPVVVDLGWVPETDTTPVERAEIVGYVRPAEYPVRFGAADDPGKRRFYALDPVAIGAALGVTGVAPYTVVAMGPERPGTPLPAQALPRPVNNHLSYALTWFGLALSSLAVFGVYARKVLRP